MQTLLPNLALSLSVCFFFFFVFCLPMALLRFSARLFILIVFSDIEIGLLPLFGAFVDQLSDNKQILLAMTMDGRN